MKNAIWKCIANDSKQTIAPWLDALTLSVRGNSLTIDFPHAFFGAWFLQNKKNIFEQALSKAFPQKFRHIIYNTAHTIPQPKTQPHNEENQVGRETKVQTFKNFLYNEKNAFPLSVLEGIAKKVPGTVYTPVLLCGASGSGKTHLLQALAQSFLRKKYAICVTSHVQDLVQQELLQKPDLFWKEYAGLFVDDIQDIRQFPEAEILLIHCIDTQPQNRQLFLTLQGSFHAMDYIDKRLQTRIASGLILELELPDIDVRLACIQNICTAKKIKISHKHMLLLAQRYTQYRHLQGILLKIIAFAGMHKRAITQADVELVLQTGEVDQLLDYREIMEAVAKKMNVTIPDILGKERKTNLVLARQVAMYMCRNKLGLSYPDLGHIFGNKDHSTVMYAIRKVEKLLNTDIAFNKRIAELDKML